jgi:hypothetical protein
VTRLLLVASLLFTSVVGASACATRRVPPPLVQRWQAVFADKSGFAILHRATVTELHPFLRWTTVCQGVAVLQASSASCNPLDLRVRVFELVALDEAKQIALYREVR